MVQRTNQQAKDGLCQLLEKTPEDRRPKTKVKTKDMEIAPNVTTKNRLTGGRQGGLPRSSSKKRERFPTTIGEYEENEVRDLLALERPKKKKKKMDYSKVLCLNCKKLKHCAKKCPERNNKVNKQRRTDLVTY
jgi:radical SAM protein with 4Fe4S-binding SPASM domain